MSEFLIFKFLDSNVGSFWSSGIAKNLVLTFLSLELSHNLCPLRTHCFVHTFDFGVVFDAAAMRNVQRSWLEREPSDIKTTTAVFNAVDDIHYFW